MITPRNRRPSANWGCDRPARAAVGATFGFAAVLGSVLGCTAATVRPTFAPSVGAPVDTLSIDAAELVRMAEGALGERGIAVGRTSAEEGYLETRWFDVATVVQGLEAADARAVRLRVFTDPVSEQLTQIVIEPVYRWTLDPSLPERQTEMLVPHGSPIDSLARSILQSFRANEQ